MTVAFPPDLGQLVNAIYPPARQALADSLAAISRRLFLVDTAVRLALLIAFWRSGAAALLRARLQRATRWRVCVSFAFIALALIGYAVVTLPLAWYGGYTLPHVFGLSAEPARRWLRDWAVGLALSTVVTGLVGALFVFAAQRMPRRWPLLAGAVALPLIVFAFAIYPVFVAPLFNTFTPMPRSPLADSILALARAQGVKARVVYEYDMSRQTNEADAYVAGAFGTERIAIGDTLLRELSPNEVLYVLAHEIGHYKLRHLWIGAALTWIDALIAITLLYAIARSSAQKLGDPAALAFVALVLSVYGLLTAPAANAVSRRIEHAADAFAATHTRLDDAGARAFARLADQNLSPLHPPPLVVWYFYTHPPIDERIVFAHDAARAQAVHKMRP